MADSTPELYQLIGAALRDIAQARFNADLFSRQISFVYEKDSLLRRFPVPRVDIDEAEITLYFAIQSVELDPQRQTMRNAEMGSLFDQYSIRIVRESIESLRHVVEELRRRAPDEEQQAMLANFERRFLSDDSREMLKGRLLQYFNDNVDEIVDSNCILNEQSVLAHIDSFAKQSILEQREVLDLKGHVSSEDWNRSVSEVQRRYQARIEQLKQEIAKLRDKYPDYKLTVDASPSALTTAGATISSVKIKSSVRNYKWSKVDVDDHDLRNVRTLSPE